MSSDTWRKIRPLAIVGGTLAILFSVAYWGGAARINSLFFAGVAALSGLMLAFGLLTWWLYLSPAPAVQEQRTGGSSTAVRQAVGLLALASGLLFVTGAAWDEAWHRLYGVGGALNDFLWAPHKLIYGSLALTFVFAAGGLLVMLRG